MVRRILLVTGFLMVSAAGSGRAAGTIDPTRLPLPFTPPVPTAGSPAVKPSTGTGAALSLGAGVTGGAPAASTPGGFAGKKPRSMVGTVPAARRIDDLKLGVASFNALRASKTASRSAFRSLSSPEAARDLTDMAAANGPTFEVAWREETGTPRFLAGADLLGRPVSMAAEPSAVAETFLDERREILGIADSRAEFQRTLTETDRNGLTAVRFQQMYSGLEVWGHDVVIRLDSDRKVIGLSGMTRPTPSGIELENRIDPADAAATAVTTLAARDGVSGAVTANRLLLYPAPRGLRPAWKVTVEAGLAYRMDAFVDALSGEFLHAVTLVHSDGPATGAGLDLANQPRDLGLYQIGSSFFMINTGKDMFTNTGSVFPDNPKGAIVVIDAQHGKGENLFHVTSNNSNSWNAFRNAVSAASFAGDVYDYFRNHHNRMSIDGASGAMWIIVNFDQNYDNAFWNGQFMVFGNGNGSNFSDLAGALDVTAHEMSHGVVEKTAGLVYEFQSGALNEHFADAFGAATEFAVLGSGGNWLLGEDVTTPGIGNDALRNMEHPDGANVAFGGQQPAHMDQFNNLTADQDHGGVHINSGIPNRAFFLTADAIGVLKAEQIWYRALTQYLVRNSQFIDFRIATIRAAGDLFPDIQGVASAEKNAVIAAMNGVGIVDGTGTSEPPPIPDNDGTDFLAVAENLQNHILRIDPAGQGSPVDISFNSVGAGGRPSFSDDGSLFAWVSQDGNIHAGLSNGSAREALSTTGGWWSVALSPDKQYLAATTVEEDGRIYVVDLDTGNLGFYEPSSQNSTDGAAPDLLVFADVLEFTADGQFLVYDALNRSQLGTTTYEYWDINLLRLEDAANFRVLPPLPPGESVGNPSFGQNHETRLVFDYANSGGHFFVVAVDFQTGAQGTVTDNFFSDGRPTFSGDDSQVYYHYRTEEEDLIFVVTLDESGVAGTQDDEVWAEGGYFPVWFTVGQRPVPAALLAFEGAWVGDLVTLSWQVSDPGEFSGFFVSRSESPDGPWERRTPGLISAATGGIGHGRYRFEDDSPVEGTEAWYRLTAVERGGSTIDLGAVAIRRSIPGLRPDLMNAYPNPFRASTRLRFNIPEAVRGPVHLSVYDVTGRLVSRLLEGTALSAGEHVLEWTGRDASGDRLPAGEYFLRLETEMGSQTKKVVATR